ncbi:polysaccharide pyruvyl transferase protein [Rhizobium phage RHph_Y65]|uniref:Polysaccharide pyruvyl transferase protein n=1 Tax=Rhizobium phage RHph_Y65 TaxID=2509785 RepID=A0A7S5R826_9CAUD|nr:polysaccharide pyruvyl transferase protein [Rhizobium phage RHph_Y65]QIG72102.1 polysaccharide pyruvyl transferase protein [Rhizobium phage RHph_TM2_3B]QIG72464.1 polysaccharide pyruvyl transferase protein [Rhizobium phage RHph_TM3_3_6]QIG72827.1 polysaccharide pyruvyl transferase protein [Rhizobium phage RHph_Y65]
MFDINVDNPNLAAILESYRGKKIDYFHNNGNAGDAIIAVGTYQTFDKFGIDYSAYNKPRAHKQTSDTVFIAGGGNLVSYYPDCEKAIKEAMKKYDRIIVLPHSIRGKEDLLKSMDKRFTIFTREVPSDNYVRSVVNSDVTVHLEHDMAFFMDVKAIFEDNSIKDKVEKFYRNKLRSVNRLPDDIIGKDNYCFREDVEAVVNVKSSQNVDISYVFERGLDRTNAFIAAAAFLKYIDASKSITTSRLHTGIGAAMCGTPATVFDNSYGKISSIYEFSMKDRGYNFRVGLIDEMRSIIERIED